MDRNLPPVEEGKSAVLSKFAKKSNFFYVNGAGAHGAKYAGFTSKGGGKFLSKFRASTVFPVEKYTRQKNGLF